MPDTCTNVFYYNNLYAQYLYFQMMQMLVLVAGFLVMSIRKPATRTRTKFFCDIDLFERHIITRRTGSFYQFGSINGEFKFILE